MNRRYEQVLQTYNNDGVINTYTYGLQRIDSKGEINETYLYDGRGSVVGVVDNSNEFVSYSYTAYGELMPDSPTPNVFGYNAEATDYITGIQYLRARYYDATINRFFQEDDYRGDFTSPASMNRYAYVHGNPVMGVDPSGYMVFGPILALIVSEDDAEGVGILVNTTVTYALIAGLTALVATVSVSNPAIGLWVATHPILVSTIIGAISAGIGEIAGQVVTSLIRGEKIQIDWARVLVSIAVGAFSGMLGGALTSKSIGLTKLQAFITELLTYDAAGSLTKITAGAVIDQSRENQQEKAETPIVEEETPSSCEPNYRYDVYDDELDVLYDQLNKLESTGCTAATSAVNSKIKSIEAEKTKEIDRQIDMLYDQMNKLEGKGALSAVRSIEQEIRKLEEDKVSVSYNVTKPTVSQTVTERKQPVNSPVKKATRSRWYGINKPKLVAY